ncbi:MAG: acyl-CoA dehydrogenase C-terminal domain-containing protein, partial [Pseudomonadales bacterium]|nr:acyl-CoA dehydrogenase C-terminal domain-containing protein [Pseudomonadales bacterium]
AADQHYADIPGRSEFDADLRAAIINEAAKLAENVLSPINQSGDAEGCQFADGNVTVPSGFKQAFKEYGQGGWAGLSASEAVGGQNLPASAGILVNELLGSANWAWNMYTGLTFGAVKCIAEHGNDQQRDLYVRKMVEGEWTGTMCITESHCGSDVGLARTKAEPQADGSYKITGAKHFITGGDHDMAENIVHLTLARIVGAPEGTAGISLFIVPKFISDQSGQLAERNPVFAGSIEHKMGIKGSATCVMNFDGATGFLVGEENSGLAQMFTMMNEARLGTGLQGLCSAELAYQASLAYAKDRLAMRALSGPQNPDGPADPIIVHPDVRRMLLTQKALIEGFRTFLYEIAFNGDIVLSDADEARKQVAEDRMAFLTPIAKAFCTELGFESTNLGLQVFGGHGYVHEWGVEQVVRDCRIAMVYEGTTGIQALDLIGRKVLGSGGELLKKYTKELHKYCQSLEADAELSDYVKTLQSLNQQWGEMTMFIGGKAGESLDEIGAASVDYLMFSGYTCLAYTWLRMAKVAQDKLAAGSDDAEFYQAKLTTAKFYFQRILPRAQSHFSAAMAGGDSLMELAVAQF